MCQDPTPSVAGRVVKTATTTLLAAARELEQANCIIGSPVNLVYIWIHGILQITREVEVQLL